MGFYGYVSPPQLQLYVSGFRSLRTLLSLLALRSWGSDADTLRIEDHSGLAYFHKKFYTTPIAKAKNYIFYIQASKKLIYLTPLPPLATEAGLTPLQAPVTSVTLPPLSFPVTSLVLCC